MSADARAGGIGGRNAANRENERPRATGNRARVTARAGRRLDVPAAGDGTPEGKATERRPIARAARSVRTAEPVRIVLPEALRELAGGRGVVELRLDAGEGAPAAGGEGTIGHVAAPDGHARGVGKDAPANEGPDAARTTPITVGAVLATVRTTHPGLYDRLMTERGVPRPHVNIFVDGENIRFTGGLETEVAAGRELVVLPAISGG